MSVLFSPWGNQQFFDENGDPAIGWKIYTYAAGSSTPLATYTDSTGTVAQSAAIVLNALGFPTNGQIWLASGTSYKLILTDANDVEKKTEDYIVGVSSASSAVSQWQPSSVTPTYVSATSFTVPGDQTTELHVGRRLQFTTTAGVVYGTIVTSAYTTMTTVTVEMDNGLALDSGLSVVNLSILRADNPALPNSSVTRATLGLSALVGRNRIINGNFAVNQRAVSGSVVLAAGAYGHDRWKAGAGGCTYTFAASGNDTVITITAGSLMQVIEDKNIEGGTYRLSHAGTAQARVAVNGAATSGSYAAAPFTTATATANQTITVEFSTGTVSKVMLEPGTVETPFERRPYGIEYMLCRRYYKTDFSDIGCYVLSSSSNIVGWIAFDVPMRVAPSIVFSGTTISSIISGPGASNVKATGFGLAGTTNGTGSGDARITTNWTASAEL